MDRNENHSNNNNDGPWAKAIQIAAAYAFDTADNDNYRDKSRNTTTITTASLRHKEVPSIIMLEAVDRSLMYLEVMRGILEKQENWEWVPYPCYPPTFSDIMVDTMKKRKKQKKKKQYWSKTSRITNNDISESISKSKVNNLSSDIKTSFKNDTNDGSSSNKSRKNTTTKINNRFASIASDSSDDDDGEFYEGHVDLTINDSHPHHLTINGCSSSGLSAKAASYSPPKQQEQDQQQQETMDTLRLLVRMYACVSDLHAKKARILANQRRWLPGAGALQSSIVALARGLELADAEISKTLAIDTVEYQPSQSLSMSSSLFYSHDNKVIDDRRVQLERDADIVHVSTKYLVQEKDRYLKKAHRQVVKLDRILEGMYRKRDEAKKNMGKQWGENKSPKGLFAKTRDEYERELRSLEEALKQLEGTNEDASTLVDEADRLRYKLRETRYRRHRYNGRRQPPSSSSYPDASSDEYGWLYTGSINGRGGRDGGNNDDDDFVEFFEKEVTIDNTNKDNIVLVKLDLHFRTGAVKTVVERGSSDRGDGSKTAQSTTLLFSGDDRVDLVLYRRILAHPLLVHRRNGENNYLAS